MPHGLDRHAAVARRDRAEPILPPNASLIAVQQPSAPVADRPYDLVLIVRPGSAAPTLTRAPRAGGQSARRRMSNRSVRVRAFVRAFCGPIHVGLAECDAARIWLMRSD